MNRPIVAVAPRTQIGEAQAIARDRRVRHLLVVDEHDLVGVVSVGDFRSASETVPVMERMQFPVLTIEQAATIHDAAAMLRERHVGFLPVVSGESVVGVVTRGDLLRAGLSLDEVLGDDMCASCHRYHDVHPFRVGHDVQFCEDCLDRAVPAEDDDEIAAGD
jgi:acetoin utilization protein AcuB